MTDAAPLASLEQKRLRGAALALYLAGGLLSLMTIAPLFWMVSMSLKPSAEVFDTHLIPRHPTLDNFIYVFTKVDFFRYLWNTFFVSAVVTVVALVFHSMAGYALARLRFPGRDVDLPRDVRDLPCFVASHHRAVVHPGAGARHCSIPTRGLIIPSIFNAFGIFLLRQFYLAVPRELEEAALVDGAGYFRIWWSVMVPLSRPILSALAILFFLANWNSFLWPLTITTDQKLWLVQVAIANFRQQYSAAWNYIMAASAVVALPTIVDVRDLPAPDRRVHQDQRASNRRAGDRHDRLFRIGRQSEQSFRLSSAQTRSISPENPTGEKGKGGMAEEGTGAIHARGLGRGWKISPSMRIEPGETLTLGEIDGARRDSADSGSRRRNVRWRDLILRIYWDGQEHPSVEAPLGDFFACGWGQYAQVSSLAVCVNPGRAFNCYWEMPFRKGARADAGEPRPRRARPSSTGRSTTR